jgi:hypothetical protein
MAFNLCVDLEKSDGPLNYMIKLMEKTKSMPPEDWQGAFNWDFKPVPPEFDMDYLNEEEEDEDENEDGTQKK